MYAISRLRVIAINMKLAGANVDSFLRSFIINAFCMVMMPLATTAFMLHGYVS